MKYLLSWSLVIIIGLIWFLFYKAGDLPYDDNYANLLVAFLLSILTSLGLLFLFFKNRKILCTNLTIILVFLISSSPISLFYLALYYEEIFGKILAV